MAVRPLTPETCDDAPDPRGAGSDPVKRRQIVDGAKAVFLDKGFEGASMGEIARIAGVSKGTLYVYFQNKEQLFCAIMQEERQAHSSLLSRFDPAQPIDEVLTGFGVGMLQFLLTPVKIAGMRTAMAIAERMPEVGREFFERGPGRTIRTVSAYLDAKIADGTLEPIADTGLAASQFIDMCQSTLLRPALFGIEIPPGERDQRIRAVVDQAVSTFLRAHARRGGPT